MRGNAIHLHGPLGNLTDNTLRHARTVVGITLTGHGGALTIQVHNDGSNIAPADRERIFDRFTRLDETRSRDADGGGPCLAIAGELPPDTAEPCA
ncbi:ATP-binding protein [Streptomyces sp. NPDC007861]|uniref:ATP-binding protein n=1 Tax=Streptomyces sp. NPDC007861 TaxID=3154893 RepID=UPI0033FFD27C